jgi:hypothetical protein
VKSELRGGTKGICDAHGCDHSCALQVASSPGVRRSPVGYMPIRVYAHPACWCLLLLQREPGSSGGATARPAAFHPSVFVHDT